MRKIHLILSILAISALMFSVTKVQAFSTTFWVNNDPYYAGWTELQGIDPVYGEAIYKDLISPTLFKVHAGDVRLTPVSDGMGGWYPAGSTVGAMDFDVGNTIKSAANWGTVKHAENVAVDTFYSYGEFIYKAAGTTVAVGDTRYSKIPGYKLGSVVAGGDLDIGTALTTFKPSTAAHYERFTDNLDATVNAYDFARLYVSVFMTTDIPNDTPDGMRGFQMKCSADPTVLTPLAAKGGVAGVNVLASYLADIGSPLTTGFVQSLGADYIEMSENILGDVPNGAGDLYNDYYPLVTFVFIPQSQIDYSPIHLNPYPGSGDYQDAGTLTWHQVTLTDGNYNVPSAPEFPLGIGALMSIVALIPVIYMWQTRKPRRV